MSESRPVVLHAVGDIAIGDHPLCAGFGTHSRSRRRPPEFLFQHVVGLLKKADLRFGNLECTLSDHGLRENDYHSIQMRGNPGYLPGLAATGFQVLNVANNHSMQHGPEPFKETAAMLRGAGIGVCGVRNGSASIPASVEIGNLKIAFLGYSLRPRQYFTEEPLYAEGRQEDILADVRAVRQAHDIVVVSLHWGDEFIERPSPADVGLAHAIIEAGTDLIIGHHPHVLRGVERYGKGWIVYSLGNFVCDMLWDEELRETAICECHLTSAGVTDVRLIPVRINDDSQPVPLQGAAAARLEQRLQDLSALVTTGKVGVSASAIAEYDGAAGLAHSRQRTRSHMYFLRNAYRFPPRVLIAQLRTYARNRLAERGVGRP